MQRVAIGRALVRRPKAMLMDEPIGALDAKLREEMRAELKRLHIENGSTTIYVTHDQVEAMCLADRIVDHERGRAAAGRHARRRSIAHPANLFVAQFVGSPVMNIAPARDPRRGRRDRASSIGGGAGLRLPGRAARRSSTAAQPAGHELVARRPARRRCWSRTRRRRGFVPVEAHIIEPLGAYDIVDLKVGDADAAGAHHERLRRQAGRRGLGAARPGAGAFLRRRPAATSLRIEAGAWRISGSRTSPSASATTRRSTDLTLDIADGEFFVLLGADRRRQDHDAAADRRAREARRRPGLHRRRGRRRLERGRARRGAGASAILALPALHGARRTSTSR